MSTVNKILESITVNKIHEHLEKHRLRKLSQHELLEGFSYLANLLSFYKVSEAIDTIKAYDTVYLDFSQAFDRVPCERLIRKTETYEIGKDVLGWFKEWLRNRKQKVYINGQKLDWE